ncbi:MAG: flavin reductase family protein [Candidatus Ranarchaeia archaeon]
MKRSLGAKTIAFPTPVWLIGTYDKEGMPNVMTAAWAGICCSKPPCITVSLRKATYTYHNLIARKAFTVSIPSARHVVEADYIGLVSAREVDKFKETGLTPERSLLVDAPYVKECPLIIECKIIHIHEIGLHTQFIGEILDVKADEEVLDEKSRPDIEKIEPMIFGPAASTYHGIGSFLGQAFAIGKTKNP